MSDTPKKQMVFESTKTNKKHLYYSITVSSCFMSQEVASYFSGWVSFLLRCFDTNAHMSIQRTPAVSSNSILHILHVPLSYQYLPENRLKRVLLVRCSKPVIFDVILQNSIVFI